MLIRSRHLLYLGPNKLPDAG